MKHTRLLPLTVAGILFGGAGLARADFVFLKNAKNDVAGATRADLKNFYRGRDTTWRNGIRVTLLLNARGTPELKWLARNVLGTTESDLIAKINQEVFKGDMKRPSVVTSADECIAAVKKAPGGLCVVDSSATQALPPDVAVLRYDGQ
jgi:hypothetical protein